MHENCSVKLVVISSHYPEMPGGVSDYTYFLSRFLAQKNNRVFVLTTDNKVIKENTGTGVNVIAGIDKWNILAIPKVLKYIDEIAPDYVLLQYVPYMYCKYGLPFSIALLALILRFKGTKLITTFHEISIDLDMVNIKYFLISVLQRIITQFISLASYRIVITIEPYLRLISLFKEKIRIIPVGSNIIPFEVNEIEKEKIRKNISDNNGCIISTFGSGLRRTDLLIDAVKLLNDEGLNIKLIIIGGLSVNSAEILKARIDEHALNDKVVLTGYLNPEDIYKYLIVTDIYVILESVDYKGRGGISIKNTSLAAAYAAGLPIISNRGHMTDSFFENGSNIILIDVLDVNLILKEIKRLIDSTQLRKSLSLNAIKTYYTKLSWEIITSRYLELMN